MKRSQAYRFLIRPIVPLLIVSTAMGKNVQVGTCLPHLPSYSTISQAVAAVAAGSEVLVCPGVYPEQITITQPLTLRGVQTDNLGSAVVTVPSGGLTKSVVDPTNGITVFFQILVLGTGSETVTIRNIAVDGSNNGVQAGSLVGIYYQNASGTIGRDAIYQQAAPDGAGFGIVVESTSATPKTISVTGTSIHDFDQFGISTGVGATSATFTLNITANVITSSTSSLRPPAGGGIFSNAVGRISGNRLFTSPAPSGVSPGVGIEIVSNFLVSNNTVANWGIWALGDSNVITGNNVAWGGGLTLSGQNNTVQHNVLTGSSLSFNCTGTSNTVTNNLVNDAYWGIVDDHGGNIIAPNTFSNVKQLVSPPC